MFETLFSFFYLKAPRTVSSAISLGLSLDFFPVSFFFSSLGELTRVEETYPQYPECTCQRVSSIKLFSYRNNSGFRGGTGTESKIDKIENLCRTSCRANFCLVGICSLLFE